jgi:hypothetical protein
MEQRIKFYATPAQTADATAGRIDVVGVLRGGVFNGLTITQENARSASLDLIAKLQSGEVVGAAHHADDRPVGSEAVLWDQGSWDEMTGLQLGGRWLPTDTGRNARASVESGVFAGVSIVASASIDGGVAELTEIFYVDLVGRPAVPNRVIAYQQEEKMQDTDIEKEGVLTAQQENEGAIIAQAAAPTSAEEGYDEPSNSDDLYGRLSELIGQSLQQSADTVSALEARIAQFEQQISQSTRPATAVANRPKMATGLPPVPKNSEGVISFGKTLELAAEKSPLQHQKIVGGHKAKNIEVLMAQYDKFYHATLQKELLDYKQRVAFNMDWEGLYPCTATRVLYRAACERSSVLDIWPVQTMTTHCETVSVLKFIPDTDMPMQTPIAAPEALVIAALVTPVALANANAVPSSIVLTNNAAPAVALTYGVDFISDGGQIMLLTTTKTLGLNVAANSAFTAVYDISLLVGGAICAPAGRMKATTTPIQITAKPYAIALRYCDPEAFQISAKYGGDFITNALGKTIEALTDFIDGDVFAKALFAAMSNGAAQQNWSAGTDTIETLIQMIGRASIELISSAVGACRSDIVIITDPYTAMLLGSANECCRIDATNNGNVLGFAGTATQIGYPFYSYDGSASGFNGQFMIVTTRYFADQFVLDPIRITSYNGANVEVTLPNGTKAWGMSPITEWRASQQSAVAFTNPTHARVINILTP